MHSTNRSDRRLPISNNAASFFARSFDWRVLKILGAIIAIFVFMHVTTGALLPKIPLMLNISHDRSIPEWFSYGMLATSSIVLFRAFRRESSSLLISFSAILLIMLVDDSMAFHEVAGKMIANSLDHISVVGLDPKDTGEMVAYMLMGLIALPFVLYGAIQTPLSQWHNYLLLAVLVGMLGIFAVGIDLIHGPVCRGTAPHWHCFQIFDLLEDGGEMVCQAFIVAHVLEAFQLSNVPQIYE